MTEPGSPFEIFFVGTPGLEAPLFDEVKSLGFFKPERVDGGVSIQGTWTDVWRANLLVRGATRVLARVAQFRVMHLAQLDKRAHKVEWASFLRSDVPIKVEAVCRKSKIYHAGAAKQRVATAIKNTLGATISDDAELRVMIRIEDDLAVISLDTSGESLHKRGFKEAVAKAPMRETMAAMLLRLCDYSGDEAVVDPMCGSGTFVIEAAEIASGHAPGRRRRFAFEDLSSFDANAWQQMKTEHEKTVLQDMPVRFFGFDRDAGAVRMSAQNAQSASVDQWITFEQSLIEATKAPDCAPGLVIINPPYGARIGNKAPLIKLYRQIGETLKSEFSGWRVGMVTSDVQLAQATRLPFKKVEPAILHGGLRIHLFKSEPLD